MNFKCKRITPPEVEPVTIEQARLHAHISHTAEDALIEMWISSARRLAEEYQRRAYNIQKWEMTFDSYPEMPIDIPRPPLKSIESVKYYDENNLEHSIELSQFFVDTSSEPGRVGFNKNCDWPAVNLRAMSALKIVFVAGHDIDTETIPENVVDAILLYMTYRDQYRAAEVDSAPPQFYHLLGHDRIDL